MFDHDDYGMIRMISQWENLLTGEQWGAFITVKDGTYVNLRLSELKAWA